MVELSNLPDSGGGRAWRGLRGKELTMSGWTELFQGLQFGLQFSAGGRSPRRCLRPDSAASSESPPLTHTLEKEIKPIEEYRGRERVTLSSIAHIRRWTTHSTLVSFSCPRALPRVTSVTYDQSSRGKSCCRSVCSNLRSLPHTYFWSPKKKEKKRKKFPSTFITALIKHEGGQFSLVISGWF